MDTRHISIASFRALARFTFSVFRLAPFIERSNNKDYQPFGGYSLGALKDVKEALLWSYSTKRGGDP
jgi:hypothetical protein